MKCQAEVEVTQMLPAYIYVGKLLTHYVKVSIVMHENSYGDSSTNNYYKNFDKEEDAFIQYDILKSQRKLTEQYLIDCGFVDYTEWQKQNK
jgi:hypothetical protein